MKYVFARNSGFWSRSWNRLGRHPIAHLMVLYAICIAAFLASVPLPHADGHLVGSDGIFYYAYLPTLLLDHDLDFKNQYASLLPPDHNANRHPETGRNFNRFAIGAALLWTPFFLTGHLLALLLKSAGHDVVPDGIGYIYQIPTLLGSLTYGFAGILLVYRSCCRFFSRSSSAITAILIWMATNVVYYMIAEPSMSHACSLFAVALFIELWLAFRPVPAFHRWIMLGMAGGLVALVRLQDATCLTLPVLDALLAFRVFKTAGMWRWFKGCLVYGLTVLIVFAPQMAVWQVLRGSAVKTGYPTEAAYWQLPQVYNVLFSLHHGLFLWHPIMLFAAVGLFFLYRKDARLSCLLALSFVLQLCLIGSWYGWYGGDAFGSRLLIGTFPALALGLAALLEWIAQRGALALTGTAASCLIVWNALSFVQYRMGYIPMNAAISFHQMTLGKLSMIKDIWEQIKEVLH